MLTRPQPDTIKMALKKALYGPQSPCRGEMPAEMKTLLERLKPAEPHH